MKNNKELDNLDTLLDENNYSKLVQKMMDTISNNNIRIKSNDSRQENVSRLHKAFDNLISNKTDNK